MKKQSFNDAIQHPKINQPHDDPEHESERFQDEFTTDELKNAILKSSNNKSSDIDGLHVTMIKNLGDKAFSFLMTILNGCWAYHVWRRTDSRVVFIANQTNRVIMGIYAMPIKLEYIRMNFSSHILEIITAYELRQEFEMLILIQKGTFGQTDCNRIRTAK